MNLFSDIISSLDKKTENCFEDDPETANKTYVPFVVNRHYSMDPSTVLFALEIAKYADLSKDQQYAFYFHGLPKARRFIRWTKKDLDAEPDVIEAIAEYYGVSDARAREYWSMMDHRDYADFLRNRKGGVKP